MERKMTLAVVFIAVIATIYGAMGLMMNGSPIFNNYVVTGIIVAAVAVAAVINYIMANMEDRA